ncbi:MAG: zinc-dependent peptidase [Planctomycetes bacterium]|nr:zinc-dependent peptidase [Planctomycetota bacterium]
MAEKQIVEHGLSTRWEARAARSAIVTTVGVFLVSAALCAFAVQRTGSWLPLLGAAFVVWITSLSTTSKLRERRRILALPFPAEWETILRTEVAFFSALDDEGKARFRREVAVFLGEKTITGIKFELDETTRVLTAASAIIPIFGFPEWEWDQINEVLVYPDRFNDEFAFESGDERHTLGMVGTGPLDRLMLLSKPDLLSGFANPGDKKNVGLHEFAHLVDKSDGTIDGLPGVGLDQAAIGPWIALVRRKMEEIRQGDSDIDVYGLTNEAEFFAVATEYFFERPGTMRRKHPELYSMLSKVFNQDPGSTPMSSARAVVLGRRRFGRNSRCPCGSGKKYKKCCL